MSSFSCIAAMLFLVERVNSQNVLVAELLPVCLFYAFHALMSCVRAAGLQG